MRRATVRSPHPRADLVAAALAPDDTADMETTVEAGTVVTTVERETTGGLQSTLDDVLVNLDVARTVHEHAREHDTTQP